MKRTNKLPELLAPAGSPDALRAAIEGGADAVYLGGNGFNARAGAVNFGEEQMADAAALCRMYGVSLYVTLNTLLYDRECEAFLRYAATLYEIGVDAVIVADFGAMRLLRTYLPGLPVHASTQASVHSLAGAEAAARMGCRRVVLARELPLAEIAAVTAAAPIETEVFLHGALCVSHSGQCLFSSLVGGRSANRGECAQPCRLPYNGTYPISLRDLSLAPHVPALIGAGVASLKIEGRMKSPAYVYGVTSIYRRLLDEGRAATAEENRRLAALFSRGGFTDGYFCGKCERSMTGVRSEEDKSASRALPPPPVGVRKLPARGSVLLWEGKAASFSIYLEDGREATCHGAVPAPARSAPLTVDRVRERLSRTGGTPVLLPPTAIAVSLDEGLNLSPGELNALRRGAMDALFAPPVRHAPPLPEKKDLLPHSGGNAPVCTVLCLRAEQADALRAAWRAAAPNGTDTGSDEEPQGRENTARQEKNVLPESAGATAQAGATAARQTPPPGAPLLFLPLFGYEEAHELPDGVYLPPVICEREKEDVRAALRRARAAGIAYALCGNIGTIGPVREMGFTVIGDFRLNITNRAAAAEMREAGVAHAILSPELTLPQARDIGGGVLVYGRIPLMLTERCFVRENFGCGACGHAALRDRRGVSFPIVREYPHRGMILNSLPTYMGDRAAQLVDYRITATHFLFTVESGAECAAVWRAFRRGEALPCPCRRVAVKSFRRDG